MTPRLAIGIDIGGTKVAGGVVDADGQVTHRARRDTPHRSKSPSVVEGTIVEVVAELMQAVSPEAVAAVGIGAAGFVAADRATVVFAPHLSWRHEPLQEALRKRVAVPIFVDNDANAAVWAEWKFGAAAGETHVMMITLGTGIGGGILINGQVQRGRFGIAGEFGHMQVVPGGHRCECGNRGCWEQYASGNALVREARSLFSANSPIASDLLDSVEGVVGNLSGPLITQAARDGDPTARGALAGIGHRGWGRLTSPAIRRNGRLTDHPGTPAGYVLTTGGWLRPQASARHCSLRFIWSEPRAVVVIVVLARHSRDKQQEAADAQGDEKEFPVPPRVGVEKHGAPQQQRPASH